MNSKCLPEPDFSQVTVGSEEPRCEDREVAAFAYLASVRSRVLISAHRSNF